MLRAVRSQVLICCFAARAGDSGGDRARRTGRQMEGAAAAAAPKPAAPVKKPAPALPAASPAPPPAKAAAKAATAAGAGASRFEWLPPFKSLPSRSLLGPHTAGARPGGAPAKAA